MSRLIVLVVFLCAVWVSSGIHIVGIEKCDSKDCIRQTPCPEVLSCPEGHYVRHCPGCCPACTKYLAEGEKCLRAGDLIVWKIGECAPGLVCNWKCEKEE